MNAADYTFRAMRADDLAAVCALLSACGLPADDLGSSTLDGFELAVDTQGGIVGLAGFDRSGSDALLRSVALAPNSRGQRLGEQLVARRESAAQAAGVRRLFLLTTTAASYFQRLGYRTLPREQVPAAIAAHAQFRSLCPASAICLEKHL